MAHLGLGRNNVFRWDSVKYRWQKMTENIEVCLLT